MRDYPHQFSGGMRQRVLIAMAIAGRPKVLLADEPTTALDVLIQDQILSLLLELQRDFGMSMILVSHDLGVIGEMCDRVAVMYAGEIVELADTATLLGEPRHPYTISLLRSLPDVNSQSRYLRSIGGAPPALVDVPDGLPVRAALPARARPVPRMGDRAPVRRAPTATRPGAGATKRHEGRMHGRSRATDRRDRVREVGELGAPPRMDARRALPRRRRVRRRSRPGPGGCGQVRGRRGRLRLTAA